MGPLELKKSEYFTAILVSHINDLVNVSTSMCHHVVGTRKNDLETFNNSKILANAENVRIPGYSIARVNYPSDAKRDVK